MILTENKGNHKMHFKHIPSEAILPVFNVAVLLIVVTGLMSSWIAAAAAILFVFLWAATDVAAFREASLVTVVTLLCAAGAAYEMAHPIGMTVWPFVVIPFLLKNAYDALSIILPAVGPHLPRALLRRRAAR